MSFRDRIDSLSRGELTGLVVVMVITLAGAGLWYVRSLPRPVDVGSSAIGVSGFTGISGADLSTGSDVSPSPSSIFVDVTGRVRHPGVYEFAAGERVIDALNRAGGPAKGADLVPINLAAPLVDGTQILIPKKGQLAAVGSSVSAGSSVGGLININTAGETELEEISGIGPSKAAAIIQYRTENGPFASVDDLINVSGIGPATLETMRPQVTI